MSEKESNAAYNALGDSEAMSGEPEAVTVRLPRGAIIDDVLDGGAMRVRITDTGVLRWKDQSPDGFLTLHALAPSDPPEPSEVAGDGLTLEDNFGFFFTDYFLPMHRKIRDTWEKVTDNEMVEGALRFALEWWVEDGNVPFTHPSVEGEMRSEVSRALGYARLLGERDNDVTLRGLTNILNKLLSQMDSVVHTTSGPDVDGALERLDEVRSHLVDPEDEDGIHPAQEPLEHAVACLTLPLTGSEGEGAQEIERLRAVKDGAYLERNRLAVAYAKLAMSLGWKVYAAEHDPADKDWEDDWRTILVIESPEGQLTWHFHDSQRSMLAGFSLENYEWDGHDTPEKYRRLAAIMGELGARRRVEGEGAQPTRISRP